MRPVVRGKRPVVTLFRVVSCLLLTAFCQLGCSVPNLAPSECVEARDVIREFYSLHFGNDMAFSQEGLEEKKEYLAPDFYERLRSERSMVDPFTRTEDLPKAFRVGECSVKEQGKNVVFDVLLFWKTDIRTEQRSIFVEVSKVNDRWLIRNIN